MAAASSVEHEQTEAEKAVAVLRVNDIAFEEVDACGHQHGPDQSRAYLRKNDPERYPRNPAESAHGVDRDHQRSERDIARSIPGAPNRQVQTSARRTSPEQAPRARARSPALQPQRPRKREMKADEKRESGKDIRLWRRAAGTIEVALTRGVPAVIAAAFPISLLRK